MEWRKNVNRERKNTLYESVHVKTETSDNVFEKAPEINDGYSPKRFKT